ncbi:MAG: 30S ribosomal protein S8e [Thermoplasmata archaeon]
MTFWQGKSKRKFTGGKYRHFRNKKRYEIGGDPVLTKLGKEKRKIVRGFGGNVKIKLLEAENVNVYDSKTKTMKRVKVITVKENNANPHYVQRNIINKGSVVMTELGLVKITSRPGQDGILNGILLEGK